MPNTFDYCNYLSIDHIDVSVCPQCVHKVCIVEAGSVQCSVLEHCTDTLVMRITGDIMGYGKMGYDESY